ncbi:MAG UNVERIFIED_CONTAM: hypothetical protein LVR18_49690, partial [Planctomycetaceae bacterium]
VEPHPVRTRCWPSVVVVDDAIVVVEAVEQNIERGLATPQKPPCGPWKQSPVPVIAVGLVLAAVFIRCAFRFRPGRAVPPAVRHDHLCLNTRSPPSTRSHAALHWPPWLAATGDTEPQDWLTRLLDFSARLGRPRQLQYQCMRSSVSGYSVRQLVSWCRVPAGA